MTTLGIVLAAGKSTRFGAHDKLLAPLLEKPLASYAARAMRGAEVTHKITCLSEAAILDGELTNIFQDFQILPCRGQQSQSLRAAIHEAIKMKAERALITLADMPMITSSALNELLKIEAPHAASLSPNRGLGVPAIFGKDLFPKLLALEGDRGAQALLREVPAIKTLSLTDIEVQDVDTEEDLARLCYEMRSDNGLATAPF